MLEPICATSSFWAMRVSPSGGGMKNLVLTNGVVPPNPGTCPVWGGGCCGGPGGGCCGGEGGWFRFCVLTTGPFAGGVVFWLMVCCTICCSGGGCCGFGLTVRMPVVKAMA